MLICAFVLLQQSAIRPAPPVEHAVPAQFAGVYRVAEGHLDPAGGTARSGFEVIFNNRLQTNYYSWPGPRQEWTDNGILLDRNDCTVDQVAAFELTYCSLIPDAAGNSGTITICFYDEYLDCAGPAFTGTTCAYELTGLPLGDANGELRCWELLVDLQGVECDTGPAFRTTGASGRQFCWGFRAREDLTGPLISEGGLGNHDWFEWFDATTADGRPLNATDPFLGCFWFSSCPEASFDMKILGPEDLAWRRRASPPNELGVDFSVDPVAGTATWTLVDPPTPGLCYWLILGATPVSVEHPGGTLLLDPRFSRISGFLPGTTSLAHALPASIPPCSSSQVIATTGDDPDDPVEFSDAWLHN